MSKLLGKFVGLSVIAVTVAGAGIAAFAFSTPAGIAGNAVPGHYIVVFKDGINAPAATDDLAARHGLTPSHRYGHALKGFAAAVPAERLTAIERDPRVAFVSEDRLITIGERPVPTAKAGGKPAPPAQILPTGVNRINAEGRANRGAGVNVAVIDTGIDLTHPDLKANIAGGVNCSTGKINNFADGNGHGTHVAGTIAALNNGIGVVGVAPEAKLWSVRVLDNSGNGTWSSVICGIDFVTARAPANGGAITVANMSLSGAGVSDDNCGDANHDALHQAICRSRDAGVTYVVAAGNDGRDAGASVPAAYDDAVITVSALADSDGQGGGLGAATAYGPDDTFASFSNFGPAVDLGAPGVNILSTWKGGAYNTISGTSMAAPHVSGAAALWLASHPGSAWAQVRDALRSLGETAGAEHLDPSGLHGEPVLRADTL